jgi:hypothetical protein
MSTEAIPGGGQDGQEPFSPAGADGLFGEDEEAWLRRMMAGADADEAWIPEEQAEAALAVLPADGGRPAGGDPGGLAQGGVIDAMAPGPELAAIATGACDPAVLAGLTDNQVLGLAAAGRRLAGRAAWVQQQAVAEFAARRLEPDRKKATPMGFTPFAAGELVPELVVTTNAAELAMAQARDARRPAACSVLLREGRISAFQLKIITESTQPLSDQDAAGADVLLAAAAPGLTPGQLRAMAAKMVLMIDPAAARRRKDSAAKDAKVTRVQEYSGNGALCGRELPPEETLASSQHIDACARALRAAGVPGTLEQLRVRAYLDLTQGLDPMSRPAGTETGAADRSCGAPADDAAGGGGPAASRGAMPQDDPDDRTGDNADHRDDDINGNAWWDDPADDEDGDDDEDGGEGYGGGDGPRPGGPSGPAGDASTRARPPVKAVINLLVPAGTLLGWSSAPGEIAGFGVLDPQATREMTEAAAAHPETRWCVTVVPTAPPAPTAAHPDSTPGSRVASATVPGRPRTPRPDPRRHPTPGRRADRRPPNRRRS